MDNPTPPTQDSQDYYSFDLTQGQTATAVVESLNGAAAQISIVDGNGNVLATGVSGATNVSQSIEDFTAPSTGTYYVEITGDPNLQYSVVVTRGADFTLQPHNSSSTAQNLTGTGGVLGDLASPSATLYVLDDQFGELGNPYNPIYPTDPATGAFTGPPIYAPGSPDEAEEYGLNMAYDGTYIYYNIGAYSGNGELYKIDASTGAVVAQTSTANQEGYYDEGLAYLNGNLYADNYVTGAIDIYSASTLAYESTLSAPNRSLTGLCGDPDRDVLWGISPYPGTIYEISPTTGATINSGPDNAQGLYEQDMAYADGMLIVSAGDFGFGEFGGVNELQEYNPDTLAYIQSVPVATLGAISGLGGDGLGGAAPDDWYSVNVQAGQALYIQSSTPSDQGGQFLNTASLEISLYDTYGNLVAQGVKMADGRNESLFFNAPVSGNYKIDITEDPGGAGEYFLQVNTASYPSGGISGQVFNDLTGSGAFAPGDPGLTGWEVDLFDSNDNFVASQLTDSNGDFNFEGLDPGTYTVEEFVQAGWTQTAPPPPGTFTVTVTAGGVVSGLEFGNFQDITVSGEVFNDINGNGVLDPGDPGLQGWTVDLYDSAGDLLATTTTDVNGNYSFSDLGPGTYTVEEEIMPGWVQTAPAPPGTYTFMAGSGTNLAGLNFGDFESVTYTGTVYDDLSGSGVIAPGDPGLQGWTVELLDSSGNILETVTSAADGSYSFANLAPGVYTIEEVVQSGWYQTEPTQPFFYSVTATSGSSQSGLNFGNFQLVNVTGEVYNDLNGNGNLDPGEPGLQGWTVNLLNQAGNLVATTTSDANGDYEFDDLFPGTFIVEEVVQSGWVQTQPVNPNYYEFATQSGLDETGLNFGNVSSSTFTGTVYNDLNGDGSREPGEPPLAGWTIDLLNSAGNLVATTTSNASGQYTFTVSSPGVYTIEEIVQSGWYITQPTNPPGTYTVTASSGVNEGGLDFGDFKTISVTGDIYNDLDGNGLRGSGEPGLAGWTVDLEDSSGNVLASVLTDSNGNYAFTGVGGGSYQVAEVVQTGWVQTQPFYPTNYSFTSQSGLNLSALVFGDHASPPLSPVAVIDNGQPGYSELGLWSTAVGGFNGTNRVAKTTTHGGHTASATWNFTGLPSGSYDVYVTFAGKSMYSTAAPFSVNGSAAQLINESILVTQAQGGRSEGSYGGVGWVELGTYADSAAGVLQVVLSNAAAGNFVDADGVLIIADTGAPQAQTAAAPSAGGSIGTLPALFTSNGQTNSTPTVAVSGATSSSSVVTVIYSSDPPAQASPTASNIVDLALSQSSNSSTSASSDAIGSLAADLLTNNNKKAQA